MLPQIVPTTFSFVDIFNICVFLFFTVFYSYQLFYIVEVLVSQKRKKRTAQKQHKFAVMIAARNEETTIANLLHSLENQTYPRELYDIFVVADNCTDSTAKISRENGAIVFERFNKGKVGKGFALDYAYQNIMNEYFDRGYEAFLVFDADNVLDPGFIEAMNVTYDNGAKASTSYRNSKNYADNWISAGYGTWFIREAKFLSQARQDFNTNCAISGTGFFIAADVLKEAGGWKWHLLTEDIQFSAESAVMGRRIEYTPDAILYDEQPTTFRDSWTQRERWAKGFYQVFARYALNLIKGIFRNEKGHKFACYDMLMTVSPGMLLTLVVALFNAIIVFLGSMGVMSTGSMIAASASSLVFCLLNYTSFMFVLGVVTTITEWDSFIAKPSQKIKYMFTFPFFMFTYIPIAIVALFRKPQWKPIKHSVNVSIETLSNDKKKASSPDGIAVDLAA